MPSGGSHLKYSDQVRNLVTTQLALGVPVNQVASALGVSYSFVSQLRSNADLPYFLVERPLARIGRPRTICDGLNPRGCLGGDRRREATGNATGRGGDHVIMTRRIT